MCPQGMRDRVAHRQLCLKRCFRGNDWSPKERKQDNGVDGVGDAFRRRALSQMGTTQTAGAGERELRREAAEGEVGLK